MAEKVDTLEREGTRNIDFSLLVSKIEKCLFEDGGKDRCASLLKKRSVWKAAPPEIRLRWAGLAQAAGEIEEALEIFKDLNEKNPEIETGWIEHIEMLGMLDRKEEMTRLFAAAKEHLSEESRNRLAAIASTTAGDESDIDSALGPFSEYRFRERLVSNFMSLFSGRNDCFARQWVDRREGRQGYVPVRRPMEMNDVEDHLSGKVTYGIYLMHADARVSVAAIDADIDREYRNKKLKAEEKRLILRERDYMIGRVVEISSEIGCRPCVEFSGGKGYHFWYFLKEPAEAGTVRKALNHVAAEIGKDLVYFRLEVFPKQSGLSGKNLGNLVKLPLGIHRLTGKRSFFIGCAKRETEAQLKYLLMIKPGTIKYEAMGKGSAGSARVLVHPGMEKWGKDYPELLRLKTACPPLGRIIEACRRRKELSVREQKILFYTVGFLKRRKSLLHFLLSCCPEYNPHHVDYMISRIRGTPIGCRRIHSLMQYPGDFCDFDAGGDYDHPLLHIEGWKEAGENFFLKAERIESLAGAVENMKRAILILERFLG